MKLVTCLDEALNPWDYEAGWHLLFIYVPWLNEEWGKSHSTLNFLFSATWEDNFQASL